MSNFQMSLLFKLNDFFIIIDRANEAKQKKNAFRQIKESLKDLRDHMTRSGLGLKSNGIN